MAYRSRPDSHSTTPGHDWWTDNAPAGSYPIDPSTVDPRTYNGEPDMPQPPVPSAPPEAPASAAPTQPQGPNYQGAFAQIAGWFKKYTGKDPSDAEVRQWGNNLDANYLMKIERMIRDHGAEIGYWDPEKNAPRAAAPAAGGGSSSSSGSAFDEDAFWKELEALPANPENAKKIAAKYGVKVLNSKGDKIEFPDGRQFDVGVAFGTGDPNQMKWARNQIGGPGFNGRASDLLSPFPENFGYPGFTPPPDFQAPTPDEAFNDKGFQFTLKQGKDALEKSAAAQGTLLTTGTLQDLDSFSQGLASTQYDKVYGRRLGEYESKYGHAETNYDRDRGNALQEYGLRHDLYNESQDRPYGKLMGVAQLGMGMPGGQGYASGMGGTLTGIGNANAAAGMYGANAYGNAFGSLANLGGYYAGRYANRNGNTYSPYGPYRSGYRF
jgi:hypothetical protein